MPYDPARIVPRLTHDEVDARDGREAEALAAVASVRPAAARVRVPPEAEATFYRLARLPERLAALFAPLDARDPDPDDVEDLAPEARALIARHALLDDWVDAFYDALDAVPDRLHVRRPDAEGRVASGRRGALLALRAVWADDWTHDAILARMRATGAATVTPRAVWLHEPGTAADEATQRTIDGALGRSCRAYLLPSGAVARIETPERTADPDV